MPAPDTTVYQVNLKTPKGALVNIYATDASNLSFLLGEMEQMVGQVAALEAALDAASNAGSVLAPVQQQQPAARPAPGPVPRQQPAPPPWQQSPQPQQPQSQPQQASQPQQPASAAPQCVHGPRRYREGVSRSGKPYRAWFCASADRDNQCPAEWVA